MADDSPYSDDPDEPDRWEEADRAWARKWSDQPPDEEEQISDEDPAPVSEAYRPRKATAGGTTRAYGEGMRAVGPHIGLGIQIGLTMALFAGGGIGIDRWLGTEPWGVILGAALGMVGIVVLVLRIANESSGTKR